MPQNITSKAKYIVTRKNTAILAPVIVFVATGTTEGSVNFFGQYRVCGIEKKLIYLLVL